MNILSKKLLFTVIAFLLLLSGVNAQIQEEEEAKPPLTRILFVFDASQSMFGRWQSDMKINIARRLLSNLLDSLKNVENLVARSIKASKAFSTLHGSSNVFIIDPENLDEIIKIIEDENIYTN